ncbi:MAG: HAMP domain-containing protein [Chitinivibrionales bacterium]|nr:HAMP domain-containing protein [Chitinivibrionales bacterium]
MSIRTKLLINSTATIAVLTAIFLAISTQVIRRREAVEIERFRRESMHSAKEILVERVNTAYKTLSIIHRKSLDGKHLTEHHSAHKNSIKNYALKLISFLKYDNGHGYIWINDMGKPFPAMIMHPIMPQLDGAILHDSLYGKTTSEQANIFVRSVELCEQEGSGFIEYTWPRPGGMQAGIAFPKISYVTLFEPWGWVLGSGKYVDDINNEIAYRQQSIRQELARLIRIVVFVSLLCAALASAATIWFANHITNPIRNLADLSESFAARPDAPLPELSATAGDEVGKLTRSFRRMASKVEAILKNLTVSNDLLSAKNDHLSRAISEQRAAAEKERLHRKQLIQADKMTSLGILVSGVAHEINNPNNLIMLNGDFLKSLFRDIRPVLDAWVQQYPDFRINGLPYSDVRHELDGLLGGILEGSERIEKIVQNLKDFIRVDTGELDEEVDLNAVLDSAVFITNNLIKKATRNFGLEKAPDVPPVKGNHQQLEQVVINLLTNACQSLENDSAALYARTSFDRLGNAAMVEVVDQGKGIPGKDMHHVFDPFYTTKRESGGTGLGLSISYSIMQAHHGELQLTSQPGAGTLARILLPPLSS